jgi:hypothetical protein
MAKDSSIPIRCPQCKRWLSRSSEAHYCEEATEEEVVGHLEDDLLDAWQKLRETALELGPQRVYASGKAVMFARSVCYFFIKTRKKSLELCIFLPERVEHPWVKTIRQVAKSKFAHTVLVEHEDQVASPLTGWLERAWANSPD